MIKTIGVPNFTFWPVHDANSHDFLVSFTAPLTVLLVYFTEDKQFFYRRYNITTATDTDCICSAHPHHSIQC